MNVLFSPIGSTDPISNYRDGAMLHICRLYRPDKVYLYLSKEMCKYHDLDDRYRKSIEFLERDLQWQCEIEVIRDEEMENVQIFDSFIDSFEAELERIRQEDQPEKILVNVSSGTPAMKSSLQILSMLGNEILAIQVSTPVRTSNKYHEDKESYDLKMQWEFNEDNTEKFENRCMVSEAKRLLDRIRKESIEKYILVYDYEAAKILAETLSQTPSEAFRECLNIAIARNKLDLNSIKAKRKKYSIESWFPIVKDRDMKEYEYLLAMQVKLERKQYADFVKDITPIFYSLAERVLKKYCGLSFSDIGEKRKDKWELSQEKLDKLGISLGIYRREKIYTHHILKIMEKKCSDSNVLKLMSDIRSVEDKVRNLAAHEIVGVTKEWMEKRISFTVEDVMDKLFQLAVDAGISISNKERNVYKRMNEELIKLL